MQIITFFLLVPSTNLCLYVYVSLLEKKTKQFFKAEHVDDDYDVDKMAFIVMEAYMKLFKLHGC